MSLASNRIAQNAAYSTERVEAVHDLIVEQGQMRRVLAETVGLSPYAMRLANARRLAAAWNVLAGLPTELIERIAAEPSDRDRLKLLSLEAFNRAMDHPEISNFNPKL